VAGSSPSGATPGGSRFPTGASTSSTRPPSSIWVIGRGLSENRLIRHDGPLSVLKAFRPAELMSLARATAYGYRWRLDRTFPYRMTLIGMRTGTSGPAPRP
jgi:hypothetical protein